MIDTLHWGFLSLILPDSKIKKKIVTKYILSWYQNDENLMRILNLSLILGVHIFKQNEAMSLAELIISAIYDQLMKLNFLS